MKMGVVVRWAVVAVVLVAAGCATGGAGRQQGMELVFQADFEDGKLEAWDATDANAWPLEEADGGRALALFQASQYKPKVRSPFNIILVKDLTLGSFVMEARCRSTTKDYGHRDLCFFLGHQDPSHFYYVHIANQSDANANSVFLVDDKPRVSIAEDRTAGTRWDDRWHTVRIVRDAKEGTIRVFYDDMTTPIMRATSDRFTWGRVGLGSFDDTGLFDGVRIWGEKVDPPGR